MSNYFDKFSEWRKKAQEKAQELDEKYNLSDKVEQTVKAAGDAVRKGEEAAREATESISEAAKTVTEKVEPTITSAVNTARDGFQKLDEEHNITDNLKKAAGDSAKVSADAIKTGASKAVEKAEEAAEKAAEAAEKAAKVYSTAKETASDAAEKAAKAYGSARETAKEYYTRAEEAYDFGTRAARATASTFNGISSAKQWIEENPGTAALIGVAAIAGIRLGSAFPGLDKVLFGVSRHWLFHSALISVGSTELSKRFMEYLKEQDRLVAEGNLTEAEVERIRFQRKAAQYVGAPLLGAFNIALGTTLLTEIFTPGRIVGFPIDIVLGGNPILETVWLFGNGLVCIYNGYQLVMYAFEDQEEFQRIVREIKALLPEDAASKPSSSAA
ncbi:MAG TPA: hypothetical protein PLL06_00985 [Acidobacteriota bacterium]|nr:hypothetical protein [Acidobacteriota bacterium]HMZ78242.1 hypothetical protein [Acidobacteriota bacterium]HNB70891.1 hypothetical protein [Acidobacteriota bacterium]HND18925.1 hypothetical protein [Acidobacteriota bacterium]HNG91848.1 hypothetical protein [Acidobacteriota bacterium]